MKTGRTLFGKAELDAFDGPGSFPFVLSRSTSRNERVAFPFTRRKRSSKSVSVYMVNCFIRSGMGHPLVSMQPGTASHPLLCPVFQSVSEHFLVLCIGLSARGPVRSADPGENDSQFDFLLCVAASRFFFLAASERTNQ